MELFFSEVWLIYEYQRGLCLYSCRLGTGSYLMQVEVESIPCSDKAMLSLLPFVPLVAYGYGLVTLLQYFC